MNPFKLATIEALKVAVVAWGVVAVDPWTSKYLPGWDPVWRYFVGALVAALVLEILLQIVLGRPGVQLHWEVKGDPITPTSQLVVKMSRTTLATQAVELRILSRDSGWVSYVLLRMVCHADVRLEVRLDQSSLRPVVERSSEPANVPSVVAVNASHGFVVDLGRAPRRSGQWHEADMRWESPHPLDNIEYNVDYVFTHDRLIVRLLLLFWRRDSNVQSVRVIRR